ncbi:enoyl-CoA hydratase [Nostoc sp. 3335mG]|nr:enoyl-CoA hydratase [Nostoc sp. 3335mG]
MTEGVQRIDTDGVIELRFTRPDKKNAITAAMYRAMTDALSDAAARDDIAAVLLSGEGDSFSAGNDLKDFMSGPQGASAAMEFVMAIAAFGKPIVAAVQGQAVGIGTTMLLHCDLVYAAPDARFTVPFAKLGLVPEAASSLLLPARIGQAKAAAMFLLGEPLDAGGAEKAGLVTAVVPADALLDHARAKAAALTQMPPQALARTRALMRRDPAEVLARAKQEQGQFAEALAGAEAKEAFAAFFEKRAPVFRKTGD